MLEGSHTWHRICCQGRRDQLLCDVEHVREALELARVHVCERGANKIAFSLPLR